MSRADLEEQRRFLLDSLRDLERERESGEIDEPDYRALRDDYTARAAEVLRALEAHSESEADRQPEAPAAARPPRGPGKGKGGQRMVATVLLAAMVLLAGASVFVLSGDRKPGQPATGSLPSGPAEQLALAHEMEGQGEAVEALKLYDAVLRDDPSNVEALAYRGWLLKLAGLADKAQESLDRAVALDPRYPDARFFRGMLLLQDRKDPAAAIPEFEAYLASDPAPGTRQAVQDVLDRARREVAQPPPG